MKHHFTEFADSPFGRKLAFIGLFGLTALAIGQKQAVSVAMGAKPKSTELDHTHLRNTKNHSEKKGPSTAKVTSDDGLRLLKGLKKDQPELYKLAKARGLANTVLAMSPLKKPGVSRYNSVEILQLTKGMDKLNKAGQDDLMIYEAIKFFEGEEKATYKDHLGKTTIGIGFLLPKAPEKWRKKIVEDIFGKGSYTKVSQVGFKTTPQQRAALTNGFLSASGIVPDFKNIVKEACGQPLNDDYNTKNIPRDYKAYLFAMLYQCPDALSKFKEYNLPLLKILATKDIDYKDKKNAMLDICMGFVNGKLLKVQQKTPVFKDDRLRLFGKIGLIMACVKGDENAPLPPPLISSQLFAMARDQKNDKNGPPLSILMGKMPKDCHLKNLLLEPDARSETWENGSSLYIPGLKLLLVKDEKGFQKSYLGENAEQLEQKNGTRINFEKESLVEKMKESFLSADIIKKSRARLALK